MTNPAKPRGLRREVEFVITRVLEAGAFDTPPSPRRTSALQQTRAKMSSS